MDTNETPEPYTAGDFAKDLSTSAVIAVAQTAIATAIVFGGTIAVGFVMQKLEDRKAKKTSTEN